MMNNILNLLEEKINPKYLIYLKENEYILYKNLNKDVSDISSSVIDNKIYEVLDKEIIKNEELYLVGVDNNELGWVSVKSPIIILNSFSERVSLLEIKKNNVLNDLLDIQHSLNINQMYFAKYICNYNNKLYVGLENNEEFLGFYPIETVDYGNIENISFEFNNSMVNVYHSDDLSNSQMIITDDREYVTEKYYKNIGLGTVKIGSKIYWFKGDETNIDQSVVKLIKKDYDEFYLEHLIESIKIDKTLKIQGQKNSAGVNQEYVESLKERTNQLKEKNIEHLENNREINKQIREQGLELKRKDSKMDYLNRLTNNLNKKNEYYVERNEKLEKRVELLEEKLRNINDEFKSLKKSKLVRIQSKFLGK